MMNAPPCRRANSQSKRAVRKPPIWGAPVGLGAYRTRTLLIHVHVFVYVIVLTDPFRTASALALRLLGPPLIVEPDARLLGSLLESAMTTQDGSHEHSPAAPRHID